MVGRSVRQESDTFSPLELVMSSVVYPHLEFNSDGVPIVSGTTTKVVEIVADYLAHRWTAEDIHRQYPYLGLAQIHAALTYYFDHQQEVEDDLRRRMQMAEEIRARRADNTLRDKLRLLGYLP